MQVFSLIPLTILLILPQAQGIGRERWSDSALQYNAFNRSKIHLSPMVTLVDQEFTLCSWVNKMLAGEGKVWAFFGTDSYPVFHISDDLKHVTVHNSSVKLLGEPEVPMNMWFHTCITWDGKSGESKLYLNGELIGAGTTSKDAKVPADSELFLNWCPYSSDINFGGELFKLQFYKTVLSVDQISTLFHQGICSDVDQLYKDLMTLPWEYFILHEKYRFNVQLVPVKCARDHSAWNFLYQDSFLGREIDEKMVTEMQMRWELLEEFQGHQIDEKLIQHLVQHHDL